jgi:hypothetical protein
MNEHQHLFLGSAGLGALPGWLVSLPTPPTQATLIPTGANPLQSAPYVQAASQLLHNEGTVDQDRQPGFEAGMDEQGLRGGQPEHPLTHAQAGGSVPQLCHAPGHLVPRHAGVRSRHVRIIMTRSGPRRFCLGRC